MITKRQFLIIVGVGLSLFCGIFFSLFHSNRNHLSNLRYTDFEFSDKSDSTNIIIPFQADSGIYIVIPSYWDINNLMIRSRATNKSNIFVNGRLTDRGWTSIFLDSTSRPILKVNTNKENLIIKILQSKLDCIFINTLSGNMSSIDNSIDKSHSEAGNFLAVSKNGTIEYEGELESIHGRGNMTWNLAKKPYSIKIKKKATLFGLNKAKKFNLLANACDETSLRNWLIFNTAQQLKIPFATKHNFVALYLNGSYNGLYQITNKIEINTSSVDITDLEDTTQKCNSKKLKKYPTFSVDRNDTIGFIKGISNAINPPNITGGYLLETNFKLNRYAESPSGFIPTFGYPIEIKSPKYATKEQVSYICKYYNEMIEAIRSEDGINARTKKHYTDYIDIDSFIYYYLCSELLFNHDAVFASFFMYKDKNAKMHCGPLWDFDLSLNTKVCFVKANGYNAFYVRESQEKDGSLMLFGQLYKHREYRQRLIEIFNTEILPIARSYYQENTLDSIHNVIETDLTINGLKWGYVLSHLYKTSQRNEIWNQRAELEYSKILSLGDYWNIKNFIEKRTELLAKVWENIDSEKKYNIITWNYGITEDFKHVPTQVKYIEENNPFSWPRFPLQKENLSFVAVVDSSGISQSDTGSFFRINYETIR